MKIIYLSVVLIICFIACKKVLSGNDENDDFKGKEHITGLLSYTDLFSGNGMAHPLIGKKVYLAYSPSDSSNYLYFAITDSQGHFIFNRLYSERKYDLFFKDSLGGVAYSAFRTVQAPNDTVQLHAVNDGIKQNALFITVSDQAGNPFNGATICVFNNLQFYQNDTCLNNLDSKVTDAYGRAIFYNLKQGTYFFRIRGIINSNNFRGDTSFVYNAQGVTSVNTILRPSVGAKNGVQIQTIDSQNNILPGVNVCVFNNPNLFRADTCAGSIASGVTRSDGTFSFNNLLPGTYYFLSRAQYANLKYIGHDSVTIDGVNSKFIKLTLK